MTIRTLNSIRLLPVLATLVGFGLDGLVAGPGSAELRIVDDLAPSGGLAVILVELTEPKPITEGEICYRYTRGAVLAGEPRVALFGSKGDVTGVVTQSDGTIEVSFNSASGSFGTDPELPIMLLTIPVSTQAGMGATESVEIDLERTTLFDSGGAAYQIDVKQGTVTVGGVSITEMAPAGGSLGSGAEIVFRGVGFQAGLELDIQDADHGDPVPNGNGDVTVTLESPFEILPTTRIRLRNPDDSSDLFFPAAVLPGLAENSPPLARDDSAETTVGTSLTIDVLSNDEDPDDDPLTVVSVGTPQNGIVMIIDGGGAIRYTPVDLFIGTDTFEYTLSDGLGGSDVGQVSVTVAPPPTTLSFFESEVRVPTGGSQEVTVQVESASTTTVRLNASDPALIELSPPQETPGGTQSLVFRLFAVTAGQGTLVAESDDARAEIPFEVVSGSVLRIPVLRNDQVSRVGLALTNRSSETAQTLLRGFTNSLEGSSLRASPPPVEVEIGPAMQMSRFIDEYSPNFAGFVGWIEVTSLQPGLHAQFLNVPGGRVTYAGDSGSIQPRKRWILTGSSFDLLTPFEYFLLNPTLHDIQVRLDLVTESGQEVNSQNLTLTGQATALGTVTDLQPEPAVSEANLYVRVSASEPVLAFQQTLTEDSIFGQAPAWPTKGNPLSLPHFFLGPDFFAEISLVNDSGQDAEVMIQLVGQSQVRGLRGPFGAEVPVSLLPGEQRILRGRSLFGDPGADLLVGSLLLEAPAGVAASGIIGKLSDDGYRTAVPLSVIGHREIVFAQVASGPVGDLDLLTGLAFHNTSPSEVAEIAVRVFSQQGDMAGSAEFSLDAGRRSSRLLTELIPTFQPQTGGHVHISSTVSIHVIEMFGDRAGSFLSTVAASAGEM